MQRKPGTTVSRSSMSFAWGCADSTAVLVSLIFAMMTPWNDPDSRSQIGAARGRTGSSFRKHRHMMEARKLLINLLYRATSQSSELPGWSHRETKPGLGTGNICTKCTVSPSRLITFRGLHANCAEKMNAASVQSRRCPLCTGDLTPVWRQNPLRAGHRAWRSPDRPTAFHPRRHPPGSAPAAPPNRPGY